MAERVEVAGTARLHMGFLDLNGSLGRLFGSIGLALDAPVTRLRLRRSDATRVRGPERERAEKYLNAVVQSLDVPGQHELTITEAIPAHAGLGSGTQLALAVAAAVRRLHGLPLEPRADAAALGRGRRSGIGISLFQSGGMVVDGGVGGAGLPPPPLGRIAVPEDWRVLLILDAARQGLWGREEAAALGGLAAMAEATAARLCRLVLMRLLPAVAEDDLVAFGAAVNEIQVLVGDHFASAQGGRFGSRLVELALSALGEIGATGLGQSSWGPTGFAFVRGDAAAEEMRGMLTRSARDNGLDIRICRALNRGAAIIET